MPGPQLPRRETLNVVRRGQGHLVERDLHHLERAFVARTVVHAQEELERRGGRELGRAAEASWTGSNWARSAETAPVRRPVVSGSRSPRRVR